MLGGVSFALIAPLLASRRARRRGLNVYLLYTSVRPGSSRPRVPGDALGSFPIQFMG